MIKKVFYLLAFGATAAGLITLCGCRSVADDPPPEPPWTPSELENALGGPDPMEGFNRSMFAVTNAGMEYVADPLGRIYATIMPRPFIEKFDNVCVNLEYPARAVSCLGQAKWRAAGIETARFFINLTLGCAGFFDVAGDWLHLPSSRADFGQAFAAWGVSPGCVLFLPFSPRTNVRDQLALILDTAFDLKTYIPYAGMATTLNRMVIAHRAYVKAVRNSPDRYKEYRQLVLVGRELQLRMWFYEESQRRIAAYLNRPWVPPLEQEAPFYPPKIGAPEGVRAEWVDLEDYCGVDPVSDSLRSLRFFPSQDEDYWFLRLSLFNRDFIKQGSDRKVQVLEGKPKLRYGFWKAPELPPDAPERLAFIIPGIGGEYTDNGPAGLAELLHKRGFKTVTLDSVFAWQFIVAFGNKELPGYLPSDGVHVRMALKAVLNDLRARGDVASPEITLMGYSFGGLHTLKVADLEREEPTLGIGRYVAINPPYALEHALAAADQLAAAGNVWEKNDIVDRAVKLLGRQVLNLADRLPPCDPDVPLALDYRIDMEAQEAACAVGMYLKLPLRNVLLTAVKERDLGFREPYRWGFRNRLYREIDAVDFRTYACKLIRREHPEYSLDELFAQAGMASFKDRLANDPKVRIFHNYDDFLLTDADRAALDCTYTRNLTWFSNGGHLGNFYLVPVQRRFIEAAAISPLP